MCRNIKTLFNFDPPVTDEEIRAASLQFVRKISGFAKPSKANEAAFQAAVEDIASVRADLSARSRLTRRPRIVKRKRPEQRPGAQSDSAPHPDPFEFDQHSQIHRGLTGLKQTNASRATMSRETSPWPPHARCLARVTIRAYWCSLARCRGREAGGCAEGSASLLSRTPSPPPVWARCISVRPLAATFSELGFGEGGAPAALGKTMIRTTRSVGPVPPRIA